MATLFRATVMLSVLVGLPAAWIYYGPLPKEQQQALDGLIEGLTERGSELLGWGGIGPDGAPVQAANAKPQAAGGSPESSDLAERAIQVESRAPAPVVPLPSRLQETVQAGSDFEPLLRQLRHLGVSQYDLETWGEAESLYRFHCKVPLVGPSAELTQQFEAITADPQDSIAQVVAEVAQWHAGHQIR
ncbi:hypothetical protein [Adhaeretor mobilis]|uniref:Uncharacterized protein n=1 Tax=Adhaeretor mobilis TaxID=1930276 RepID=A0A517N3B2_9BACT|nr:hypothetical protein [Adhaeretor mobilis]QDT01632.1 hypothetical protein HG15A2_49790 [Adhaeretor mobilis]